MSLAHICICSFRMLRRRSDERLRRFPMLLVWPQLFESAQVETPSAGLLCQQRAHPEVSQL